MLMSAYELDLDEFREVRREDYISKPVHLAQFVDALRNKLIAAYQIRVE